MRERGREKERESGYEQVQGTERSREVDTPTHAQQLEQTMLWLGAKVCDVAHGAVVLSNGAIKLHAIPHAALEARLALEPDYARTVLGHLHPITNLQTHTAHAHARTHMHARTCR